MSADRAYPRIVIIGGGFGGLYAAKALGSAPVAVTLLDKRNFHLFQPLLYQVATGGVSAGETASPIRAVLNRYPNLEVFTAEAVDIDPLSSQVILRDGVVPYDTLIVATGVTHHYFGNDSWAENAPGLKTIEDALEIRRRIFLAFEAAERQPDPQLRRAWMRIVVIGGGPTGVELAGAVGELTRHTLKRDFRHIDTAQAEILLLEADTRILRTFPPDLSTRAMRDLSRLGVSVRTGTQVTQVAGDSVTIRSGNKEEQIPTRTILWAAGMKASSMGQVLARQFGAELDRSGRVIVEPDLSVTGHANVFVIGDLANFTHQGGEPLPGIAPVAMQQGRYIARLIKQRLNGASVPAFRYRDKGTLAVIGRNAAVADFGAIKFSGWLAWLMWVFVHIAYLIEFDNKLLVLFQWAWSYVTRNKGARLITGEDPFPLVRSS